jgi:hypothetical protein
LLSSIQTSSLEHYSQFASIYTLGIEDYRQLLSIQSSGIEYYSQLSSEYSSDLEDSFHMWKVIMMEKLVLSVLPFFLKLFHVLKKVKGRLAGSCNFWS